MVKETRNRQFERATPNGGSLIHSCATPDNLANQNKTGILIVGHGSRRAEANDDVRLAARRIAEHGRFALVEAAFLEIASPTIAEAFSRLVKQGAEHIVVHPYFLSPGRHTRGDIPVEVASATRQHHGVTYQITEPLAAHRLVIDASVQRIRETDGSAADLAPTDGLQRGTVYLAGAGPGDPGLLTIKALEILRRADVVIYDYLVDPDLLVHVRRIAERIYVGKVGGGSQTPQPQINELLIARAREGKIVLRLKGGDPFLFGRGAEEALALHAAGVPFEIVPGVSSVLAVPAYAGIPLTHRGLSSSVTILTGARAYDGKLAEDLIRAPDADTIVVLMGVAHLRRIAEILIAAGRPVETPAAVIRWGSYEAQQIVVGTLRTIADRAEAERLRAPSVIVIGEVVRLRESLDWFGRKEFGRQLEESIAEEAVLAAVS